MQNCSGKVNKGYDKGWHKGWCLWNLINTDAFVLMFIVQTPYNAYFLSDILVFTTCACYWLTTNIYQFREFRRRLGFASSSTKLINPILILIWFVTDRLRKYIWLINFIDGEAYFSIGQAFWMFWTMILDMCSSCFVRLNGHIVKHIYTI